jgi:hypothetical protein
MAHVLVRDFTTTKFTRQPKSTFLAIGLKSKNLLSNFVDEKNMLHQKSGKPWRGPYKKSPRFLQNLIELFTPSNGRVVDFTCSTGASIMATRTCGRHLLAFEGDNDMFKHILKPLLEKVLKEGSSMENVRDLTGEDDDLSDEEMLEFECE